MKKLLIPLGIILIIAAGVVKFGLSQQFNQRFPAGWRWEANILGRSAYADPQTGQFAEGITLDDEPINLTERSVNVDQVNTDGTVNLVDHYTVRNPVTNTVDWELSYNATVDAMDGHYLDQEYAGDYYLFPRDAQKTTYVMRNSSFLGVPMSFQGEETTSGLNTYLYSYKGIMSTITSYPDIPLEDGQTISCIDLTMNYWVEPKTGEVVKLYERCEGDWIVDAATGEPIAAIARWQTETTGDDLIIRVAAVQSALDTYNWVTLYIPLGLLVGGIIAMAAAFLLSRGVSVERTAA